jgi:hypothetical protein
MKKFWYMAACVVLAICLLAGCSDSESATVGELADDDAIFTVTYAYIRPTIHDDEIETYCEEHGFKQITKNEDGSYTFRQDRTAYEEKMADRKASLIEYLEEFLTNDEFGAYVLDYDLDEDNDFRDVTITVDSTAYLDATDQTDLLGEYIIGVYQYFMEDDAGTTISYVSSTTGKVLNSETYPSTSTSDYSEYYS